MYVFHSAYFSRSAFSGRIYPPSPAVVRRGKHRGNKFEFAQERDPPVSTKNIGLAGCAIVHPPPPRKFSPPCFFNWKWFHEARSPTPHPGSVFEQLIAEDVLPDGPSREESVRAKLRVPKSILHSQTKVWSTLAASGVKHRSEIIFQNMSQHRIFQLCVSHSTSLAS